jgi:hypothetical protein
VGHILLCPSSVRGQRGHRGYRRGRGGTGCTAVHGTRAQEAQGHKRGIRHRGHMRGVVAAWHPGVYAAVAARGLRPLSSVAARASGGMLSAPMHRAPMQAMPLLLPPPPSASMHRAPMHARHGRRVLTWRERGGGSDLQGAYLGLEVGEARLPHHAPRLPRPAPAPPPYPLTYPHAAGSCAALHVRRTARAPHCTCAALHVRAPQCSPCTLRWND